MKSLELLKSSARINEDNKIFLLDPERYSEEFKEKVYGLLTKANFNVTHGKKSNNFENLVHKMNVDAKATESADQTRSSSENLPDLKMLTTEERNYISHLSFVHLQLAHQRNQLLHWFFIPAMAALACRNSKEGLSEGNVLYSRRHLLNRILMLDVNSYSCFGVIGSDSVIVLIVAAMMILMIVLCYINKC